jgi:trehalose 6-phosphate synthase
MTALRLLIPLLFALGTLAWGGCIVANQTFRYWYEHALADRAYVAVRGAREALARSWREDPERMVGVLAEIARDEQILGVEACGPDLGRIATARGLPAEIGCDRLAALGRGVAMFADRSARPVNEVIPVRTGELHLSAVPVVDEEETLGVVVVVHEMSGIARVKEAIRRTSVAAFVLVAGAIAGAALISARSSRRRFTAEMRALLRAPREVGALIPCSFRRRDLQPILADVRDFADRVAEDRIASHGGGPWSAERLRQTLVTRLQGESVVVLANREPYVHVRDAAGEVRVTRPAGGLVTALEPVMRACSGVWVAHGSGSGDRETADAAGRLRVPPGEGSYELRRVWLSRDEVEGYYYGFANEGLWPLSHSVHVRPMFRAEDWEHYRRVNRKFADAVCEEVECEDPIVLVQDYHFALAPRMIRERLPRATVITFWHIPWPTPERLGICPWGAELLDGLLGSSVVGFHTQRHCNDFLEAVDRYLEARIDREDQAVVVGRRPTLVRAYPISVEWPNRWAQQSPPVEVCRRAVREELGLAPDAVLGVGVDRLDYTKGIEERLRAVERLLERDPRWRGRFHFLQVAAPSRSVLLPYRDLARSVETLAARINSRFGVDGRGPIVLLRESQEPPRVFELLRAADLCYVSSLHDGMNLVAKEFVAARDDDEGVLLLSRFTGAARELKDALLVNPYDLDEASAALRSALEMSRAEQRERMRAMRAQVAEWNVYRWAGCMLDDAARLRERERRSVRLVGRRAMAG